LRKVEGAAGGGDGDGGRGARRGTPRVADRVGEAVLTDEAGIRGVSDAPVGGDREAAVRGNAEPHEGERIAVRIGVVGEQIERDRGAGLGGRAVVMCHRRGIRAAHEDLDLAGGEAAATVPDRVVEAVGALEARCGSVGHSTLAEEAQAAVLRCAECGDGDRIAVGIEIVGDKVDRDRNAGRGRDPIAAGDRRSIGGPDADPDRGRSARAFRVAHGVGEAVLAREAGARGVAQPSPVEDRDAAGLRHPECHEAQGIAVGIGIVGERVDLDDTTRRDGRDIVDGHGRTVRLDHADRDRRGRGGAGGISNGVVETVLAHEARRGRVGEAPGFRVEGHGAEARLLEGDDEEVARAVVGERPERDRDVACRLDEIGLRCGQGGILSRAAAAAGWRRL